MLSQNLNSYLVGSESSPGHSNR